MYSFSGTMLFIVTEKQKCFPRTKIVHHKWSWIPVTSCQCREEEEIHVSRLCLAVASAKFLVIFRKLPLVVLGMCHFHLSETFQSFTLLHVGVE